MKLLKYYTVSILLLSLIFAVGCELNDNNDSFDWDLRGTWESNDPSIYSGRITINYDTIKIENYNESQTHPYFGDDKEQPFKDIPKGIALKGYSEDGRIFIEGFSAEGFPYELIETANYNEYILRFKFGGRYESLQKIDY